MEIFRKTCWFIFLFITLFACKNENLQSTNKLDKIDKGLLNEIDSMSYFTGIFSAYTLKNIDCEGLDADIFNKALNSVLVGTDSTIPGKSDADFILGLEFGILRDKQNNKNLKEGLDYLEQNKNSEGIKTTPSGLQYQILSQGNGDLPTKMDVVVTNYVGKLLDGNEFINTYQTGKSDTIDLKEENITGLTEALLLMKTGSKYKIFLPTQLAFGDSPPQIPGLKPNMPIIIEIELLDIIK